MKRALDITTLNTLFPVEVWGILVDKYLTDDIDAVRGIFLLNKDICRYLSRESSLVIDFFCVSRLNRHYRGSRWFICESCNKLRIREIYINESYSLGRVRNPHNYDKSVYCHACMKVCPVCKCYNHRGNSICRCLHKFVRNT